MKIAIAAAILGVVVFNASLALNIGKCSDITLNKVEVRASGENNGEEKPGCRVEEITIKVWIGYGPEYEMLTNMDRWCHKNQGYIDVCIERFRHDLAGHSQGFIECLWPVTCYVP